MTSVSNVTLRISEENLHNAAGRGAAGMSALGQKQTYAVQQRMSALPPIATAKADIRKRSCLPSPPIADMCGALAYVR